MAVNSGTLRNALIEFAWYFFFSASVLASLLNSMQAMRPAAAGVDQAVRVVPVGNAAEHVLGTLEILVGKHLAAELMAGAVGGRVVLPG